MLLKFDLLKMVTWLSFTILIITRSDSYLWEGIITPITIRYLLTEDAEEYDSCLVFT